MLKFMNEMIQMEDLKEMFEEVKGYRKRGKDNIATLIERFDVDIMVSLSAPSIQAELEKVNVEKA